MSIRCVSWVLDQSDAKSVDRLVLIALADDASDDGASCFPSMDRLAHKARIGKGTVKRSIDRLEESGTLLVKRPESTGRGKFNRYLLVMGRDPAALLSAVDEDWTQVDDERFRSGTFDPENRSTDTDKRSEKDRPGRNVPTDPVPKGTNPHSRDEDSIEFRAFWSAYPRKTKKPTARLKWRQALKRATVTEIMTGLDLWCAYWHARNEPQFVPYPATWLHGDQWNDDPPPVDSRMAVLDAIDPGDAQERSNGRRALGAGDGPVGADRGLGGESDANAGTLGL